MLKELNVEYVKLKPGHGYDNIRDYMTKYDDLLKNSYEYEQQERLPSTPFFFINLKSHTLDFLYLK